ncbi:hypothetical protein D7X94_11740 [Acutalibacter sp. 1XD8-33]|uniref:hypothetical protein n=1 Tax=Acutalibacter sp. 1XD8-33 TaxID=2320081 RepID=UPI000EA090FD|nr:hypothetical protein [Acutalibacter sp. 1XD8-33]RKJ39626.1 hypothetical protein D7X94_11740 [Acutalibacter sp. 1XD8-33]
MMDLEKLRELWNTVRKDKRFIRLVFLLGAGGIALIYLSTWFGQKEPLPQETQTEEALAAGDYQRQLEQDLRRVVRAVTGEPDPEVMVTLENGGEAVYAEDRKEDRRESGGETERTYVILKDSGGAQRGLSITELRPKVKGVVIVSRSAADPAAREKLVNAARTALGISSSRVCVVEGG